MKAEKQEKCIWSGERSPNVIVVTLKTRDRFARPTEKTFHVLPEYEEDLRRYNHKFFTFGKSFVFVIIVLSALMIIAPVTLIAVSAPDPIILLSVGFLIFLMGILIVIFPFSTPETNRWLGIAKAMIVTRILGVLSALFGLALYFLPVF